MLGGQLISAWYKEEEHSDNKNFSITDEQSAKCLSKGRSVFHGRGNEVGLCDFFLSCCTNNPRGHLEASWNFLNCVLLFLELKQNKTPDWRNWNYWLAGVKANNNHELLLLCVITLGLMWLLSTGQVSRYSIHSGEISFVFQYKNFTCRFHLVCHLTIDQTFFHLTWFH